MSKYIDAEAFKADFKSKINERLNKYSISVADAKNISDAADAVCDAIDLFPAADVIEMPFQTDGIALIYSDTIKVTNVEALAGKTLKAVLFYVTQEESDRYDAEAERIIAANKA